ncbi:MAG TPA: hypothetical protein VF832_19990 [Longimicrobiales bacterium]
MRFAARHALFVAAVLTSAALPFSQLLAQQNAPPVLSAPGSDPDRAGALRAKAESMLTDRSHYREAAELLRQASALDPVEDGSRADDLHLAANLLFYAGAVGSAQNAMVESAEAALARGDILVAANALVDAGWLANQRHGAADARSLAFRALHLAASPLLSDDQRDAIRKRVVLAGLEKA